MNGRSLRIAAGRPPALSKAIADPPRRGGSRRSIMELMRFDFDIAAARRCAYVVSGVVLMHLNASFKNSNRL